MDNIVKHGQLVEIPLYRGGSIVTSLPGSFGAALRETRISALFGFLVSIDPSHFHQLLGLEGRVLTIRLETYHEQDRSDILIETTKGDAVIEVKMDASNPFEQARKYSAKWRILVTNHVPTAQEATKRRVTFINWAKVGSTLRDLTASRNPILKFLSDNLLRYLEDHNMVRERESVEIYAREINEETTLKLFLKARLYGCDYQRSSRLPEALYFAPHFGRSIAQLYPGINTGISYIAKIDTVAVVETWDELIAIAKASRGTTWLRLNRDYLEAIHRKWPWKSVRYSFVFLDSPRLVFNPPIKKTHLQSGSGRLSRRTFSFDEMFQAWGK